MKNFALFATIFFFATSLANCVPEDDDYTPPKPLPEAKPAPAGVVIPLDSGCCPHHECCDAEGSASKSRGDAEKELAKAAKKEAEVQGSLGKQEQLATERMAEEAAAQSEAAEDSRVLVATKDEAIANEKKEDTEHELDETIEVDRHEEAEMKQKAEADIAAKQRDLRHEEQNLNKLTTEEGKLGDTIKGEEGKIEDLVQKEKEIDEKEEADLKHTVEENGETEAESEIESGSNSGKDEVPDAAHAKAEVESDVETVHDEDVAAEKQARMAEEALGRHSFLALRKQKATHHVGKLLPTL